jgi:arginine/ornithine N-succinyltransferase beta subunit
MLLVTMLEFSLAQIFRSDNDYREFFTSIQSKEFKASLLPNAPTYLKLLGCTSKGNCGDAIGAVKLEQNAWNAYQEKKHDTTLVITARLTNDNVQP